MKTSKEHTVRHAEKDVDPDRSKNFPLRVTPEFKRRIHLAARYNGSSISAFIREAVTTRLEMSEARQRQEREEKKAKERPNTFRTIGESKLAPAALTPLSDALSEPIAPAADVLPKDLYREHAKRIAAALDRPREMRLRLDEAVVAIKKQWPLTHPSDEEIVERLEKLVAAIVEKTKPPTPKDDVLVGKTLTGAIKTYGYTPAGDDNETE